MERNTMATVLTVRGENRSAQMHRRLLPFEHLLWLVDQWTPRHFIFVSRVEGAPIAVGDLQSALLKAQLRHPILRTAIKVNRDGTPKFILCEAPIPLRVIQRKDSTQWLQEVETQLAVRFEPDDQPLMRVSLVRGEAASELILVVHHSIGDGLSATFLVRDLLKSMEGYTLAELPPRSAFEDLLGCDGTAPLKQPQGPATNSYAVARPDRPQAARVQVFEIGPEELTGILARCRREGTTLQAAMIAALLLSLPGKEAVRCLTPINIRSLLPDVTEDFGLFISSGTATLDRNTSSDFWSLARTAREETMQAFDLSMLQAKESALASTLAGTLSPQEAYEGIWRRGNYHAVLTNLGRLPEMPKLKRFRLTAAYLFLSPELEPVVAAVTVNERAFITISAPPPLADMSLSFFDQLRGQA
jgi:NRPS condensation-like uncharacterized protein